MAVEKLAGFDCLFDLGPAPRIRALWRSLPESAVVAHLCLWPVARLRLLDALTIHADGMCSIAGHHHVARSAAATATSFIAFKVRPCHSVHPIITGAWLSCHAARSGHSSARRNATPNARTSQSGTLARCTRAGQSRPWRQSLLHEKQLISSTPALEASREGASNECGIPASHRRCDGSPCLAGLRSAFRP